MLKIVAIRNRWHLKKEKLITKIFEVFSSIVNIIQEILFIRRDKYSPYLTKSNGYRI